MILIITLLLNFSTSSFAQHDSFSNWNWIRIEGDLETGHDLDQVKRKIPLSLEIHYRTFDDNALQKVSILRPMIGYRVDEKTIAWLGYAYVESEVAGNTATEHRIFQLVTTTGKSKNSKTLYLIGARLEERFLDNEDEMAVRLRMIMKLTQQIHGWENNKLYVFAQNEYFTKLNETAWTGDTGFDQNRLMLGLEWETFISNRKVTFGAGYLNNTYLNPAINNSGVGFNLRINLNRNKKKK